MIDETVRQVLKKHLVRDEGWKRKLYKDTQGVWTIGCGRNLIDNGVSDMEAEMLLNNDIDQAEKTVLSIFGSDFYSWAEARQLALLNMAFNLGVNGLKTFTRMIAAIKENNWDKAAQCALESLWAKQVKGRAVRIAAMMKDGVCEP